MARALRPLFGFYLSTFRERSWRTRASSRFFFILSFRLTSAPRSIERLAVSLAYTPSRIICITHLSRRLVYTCYTYNIERQRGREAKREVKRIAPIFLTYISEQVRARAEIRSSRASERAGSRESGDRYIVKRRSRAKK